LKEIFTGIISDGRVVVRDAAEASKIHNKGQVGEFVKGGALSLSFPEAFYLMNEEKLVLEALPPDAFLRQAVETMPNFEVRYLVYRDLRKRGFIVTEGDEMEVARGGETGGYAIIPVYEREPFSFDEIYERVKEKKRIFAVVDGDGDLTYYSVEVESPKGPSVVGFKEKPAVRQATAPSESGEKIAVTFLGETGFAGQDSSIRGRSFYGKMIGKNLHLSAIECVYLAERGVLEIRDRKGRKRSAKSIRKEMARNDMEFEQKMTIYSDLRDRELIVKTGFKYGTHFRVYVNDIEHHAPYLVHAVPDNHTGTWPEISRGVRLAHGVKKDFLLAEASKPPKYLKIKRVRL